MLQQNQIEKPFIVNKWLSYILLAAFIYYWISSIGYMFLRDTLQNKLPRQTAVYRTFCRQNWRLFAFTKQYNRRLNLIIIDKQNNTPIDTIDIVDYFVTEKRKHAPFNNYEDGLDHILYRTISGVETQLDNQKKVLQKERANETDSFYSTLSNKKFLAGSNSHIYLHNLWAFSKYVLQELKKDTNNKEYQLQIIHQYIPPAMPEAGTNSKGKFKTVFVSEVKSQ